MGDMIDKHCRLQGKATWELLLTMFDLNREILFN